jgi:EmrB/QacA subfamily drug resistance transporter
MTATALLDEAPARNGALDPAAVENPHHARRWLILAVLGIAQLMVVLDATVVNIALPTAQHALGFSDNARQWIVTAYALAFGSLLLLGGRLADLIGRKRTFLIGLAGFAVASAIGGAATSFGMLVVARAVQGGFGALLAPAGLALLTTTFTEPRERARAFGIYGAIAGAGAAVGLLLGGVLTEFASWRWTMFVNLIFAGIAFMGGLSLLHHRPAEQRPRLDLPGTLAVSGGLFALVYGFSHAQTAGWSSPTTLGFLVTAVVLLIAFVRIQLTSAHPLLPLRVVLDRNRGGAFFAMFTSAVGMFGIFLFLTYYLQQILGYSALRSGVAFLPMVVALVLASTTASTTLSGRVSPRVLIPAGLALSAVGMYLLTGLSVHSDYLTAIMPSTLVTGAGMGLVFASAMSVATLGVRPDDAGVASAAVNTVQQVGGSIGTALLNTIAATAASGYLATHLASHATGALTGHGGASVLQSAAVHSYVVAFWWSAAVFAIGALIAALILKPGVPQPSETEALALV